MPFRKAFKTKTKWIDDSQGVPLEELRTIRQETEDVKENKLKSLIIVVIFHCNQFDIDEIIVVKSYKSPEYSGWNGWQSIVIETEYGDAQVDKADEKSQRLETYDAMRKTTESEREAGDQIMEQVNKYTRNGGRRYREASEISKIESVDSKVENEMLSVKMRLTKAICWSHAKSGDDAEKLVSNDVKKSFAEAAQMLENVSEQSSKSFLIYETLFPSPRCGRRCIKSKRSFSRSSAKEREGLHRGQRRIKEHCSKV